VIICFEDYDVEMDIEELMAIGPDIFASFIKTLKHNDGQETGGTGIAGGVIGGDSLDDLKKATDDYYESIKPNSLSDMIGDLDGDLENIEPLGGDIPFGVETPKVSYTEFVKMLEDFAVDKG
jgi:hypothetical protein